MTRPRWSRHVPTSSLFAALLGVALFAAASRPAVADTPAITSEAPAATHRAEQAKAVAERAAAHIRAVGRDQAFADFSHPKLVGHNMADVRGPDGRLANVEINQLGLSQGSGWLEFCWPNPATKRIELKATYVLKVDDHTVCGSGYYKGVAP